MGHVWFESEADLKLLNGLKANLLLPSQNYFMGGQLNSITVKYIRDI